MCFKMKKLSDLDDILKAYDIYKDCMYMPTIQKYTNKMVSFLKNNSVKICACFYEEKLVGIIVLSFCTQGNAEIVGIAVDPQLRGKGIGSYMVHQMQIDYGLELIYAETDDAAVGFYEKSGFTIEKTVKQFDGQEILRYNCELKK